jgi:hypothetical protein
MLGPSSDKFSRLTICRTGLRGILFFAGSPMLVSLVVISSRYIFRHLSELTKPSSGISSLVYCFGRLFMVASALGTPVDSRQLMSFSFSLNYSCGGGKFLYVAYDLKVWLLLIGLL